MLLKVKRMELSFHCFIQDHCVELYIEFDEAWKKSFDIFFFRNSENSFLSFLLINKKNQISKLLLCHSKLNN